MKLSQGHQSGDSEAAPLSEASRATPEAGWYDDPSAPGSQRWWDGIQWTDHSAPKPQPAPDSPRRFNVGVFTATAAVAVLMALGGGIFLKVRDDQKAQETAARQAAELEVQCDALRAETAQTRAEFDLIMEGLEMCADGILPYP